MSDANAVQEALDNGRYEEATNLWGYLEGRVGEEAGNVDFYNILYPVGYFASKRNVREETPKGNT